MATPLIFTNFKVISRTIRLTCFDYDVIVVVVVVVVVALENVRTFEQPY